MAAVSAASASVSQPPVLPVNNRLFLVTDEEGQQKIQEEVAKAAAEQRLPRKAACGIAGLCILNLASLDPAIQRIDVYDESARINTLWSAFSPIIMSESNRQTALAKVNAMVLRRCEEFFSKDGAKHASAAMLLLGKEVETGLSFFSSDERYARIRNIFVKNCTSMQIVNPFQRDCLAKLWEDYKAQGFSASLVYGSDVIARVPSMEAYRIFQRNVASIPPGAIYVDASRIESVKPGEILPRSCSLRMTISPNLPRQVPDIFLFDDIFKTDDLGALRELAAENVPMDWFSPDDGSSPLMLAAFYNSVKCMSFLMKEKGASAKCVSPVTGQTALHAAGGREAAELLLAAGADLNAVDDKLRTPLYCAVTRNKPPLVQYLLSRGAFPSVPDDEGFPPIMRAVENKSPDCVRLLLDDKNIGPDEIKRAFFFAQDAVIGVMLEHPKVKELGLGVNSQDEHGATLLINAAYFGRVNDVNWLLQHGADPTIKAQGLTAQDLAQRQGHNAVAEILQKSASKS